MLTTVFSLLLLTVSPQGSMAHVTAFPKTFQTAAGCKAQGLETLSILPVTSHLSPSGTPVRWAFRCVEHLAGTNPIHPINPI
jgi:hypothetical protein